MQTYLPNNTQHSKLRAIHTPGGIRDRNPNKRAATCLRLRGRSHWNRATNLRM